MTALEDPHRLAGNAGSAAARVNHPGRIQDIPSFPRYAFGEPQEREAPGGSSATELDNQNNHNAL